jgi:hypothetical protein
MCTRFGGWGNMMAVPIPWNKARNARLVKYLDANLDQYKIAKLMGCSQPSVSRAMARIGISPPPKPRRSINPRGRPRKGDIARSLRNCIGVQCRDKPDRSFLSNGPGNRLCADCTNFSANNRGAMA